MCINTKLFYNECQHWQADVDLIRCDDPNCDGSDHDILTDYDAAPNHHHLPWSQVIDPKNRYFTIEVNAYCPLCLMRRATNYKVSLLILTADDNNLAEATLMRARFNQKRHTTSAPKVNWNDINALVEELSKEDFVWLSKAVMCMISYCASHNVSQENLEILAILQRCVHTNQQSRTAKFLMKEHNIKYHLRNLAEYVNVLPTTKIESTLGTKCPNCSGPFDKDNLACRPWCGHLIHRTCLEMLVESGRDGRKVACPCCAKPYMNTSLARPSSPWWIVMLKDGPHWYHHLRYQPLGTCPELQLRIQ